MIICPVGEKFVPLHQQNKKGKVFFHVIHNEAPPPVKVAAP